MENATTTKTTAPDPLFELLEDLGTADALMDRFSARWERSVEVEAGDKDRQARYEEKLVDAQGDHDVLADEIVGRLVPIGSAELAIFAPIGSQRRARRLARYSDTRGLVSANAEFRAGDGGWGVRVRLCAGVEGPLDPFYVADLLGRATR